MFIDLDHPDFKKFIVVSQWTGQVIPNVCWVNIKLGMCGVVILDSNGNIIINDENITTNDRSFLTAIIHGDFQLRPNNTEGS